MLLCSLSVFCSSTPTIFGLIRLLGPCAGPNLTNALNTMVVDHDTLAEGTIIISEKGCAFNLIATLTGKSKDTNNTEHSYRSPMIRHQPLQSTERYGHP